jgi:hypothetical protein
METLNYYSVREQKWVGQRKGFIIWAPHLSAFECLCENGKFYDAVVRMRGGTTSSPGTGKGLFEVAFNPLQPDEIRRAMVSLLKEKLINDIEAANCLIARMEQGGVLPHQQSIWPYEVVTGYAPRAIGRGSVEIP